MMTFIKCKLNKSNRSCQDENRILFYSGNNNDNNQKKNSWTTGHWVIFVTLLLSILFVIICMYEKFVDERSILSLSKPIMYITTIFKTLNRLGQEHTVIEKVISCYYNTPTPEASNQLMPNNIHPHLCTHINVAFARVVDKQISLDDSQYKALMQLQKLKLLNPNLKILLSVGGAGNNNGFSEMVIDHASRKVFIKSIKMVLRNYTLDGIDLDWEFPGFKNELDISKRERQHFSQLLQEIRREYVREKQNYLLTVAVPAQQTILDVSYDVDQLNLYTDYVNIMTYDFHFYSKYTPFTGLNSPLFARSSEQLFLSSLNINFTVHMYIDKGLDRSKIVVGVPTYGHTFSLVNADNTKIGSPASGFGSLGSQGFVSYPDICTFINSSINVTVELDKEAKVPYLFKDLDWVSYDTPQSIIEKAIYIKDYNLRGAMIYSLNADDYGGVCGGDHGEGVKFPLLQSVTDVLLKNTSLSQEEKGVY